MTRDRVPARTFRRSRPGSGIGWCARTRWSRRLWRTTGIPRRKNSSRRWFGAPIGRGGWSSVRPSGPATARPSSLESTLWSGSRPCAPAGNRPPRERTGLACFDAWARELLDVGYLHNHARLWFASLWIFTLELPWALGADFFLRHLLDGDPASNTLSWRWVGGLQTPGKIYLARADNIDRFTAGRFPAVTGLATAAQPLREAPLDPPRPVPAAETLERGEPLGWLITEEDCDPLSLELPADAIRAVAGMTAVSARSPLSAGPLPAAFSRGAIDDALARLRAALGCPTVQWPAGVDAATVIDWARAAGIARIATAYAPVGPTAEWLAGLGVPLARAGISLTLLRRTWDDALWPLAIRGFFPFKERVPAVFRRLGLGGRPNIA